MKPSMLAAPILMAALGLGAHGAHASTIDIDLPTSPTVSGVAQTFTISFGLTDPVAGSTLNIRGVSADLDWGDGTSSPVAFTSNFGTVDLAHTYVLPIAVSTDYLLTLTGTAQWRNNHGTNDPETLFAQAQVTVGISPTPIPATLPLFLSALAGMGWLAWRHRKMQAG